MKLIPFRMTSRITAVFTACLLLCSCGQKEDNPSDGGGSTASLENVQFAVPDKMEIEYGAASISFRVQFSKMPAAGDQIVLGGLNPCAVQNISSSFFDVNIAALWDQGFGNGNYTVSDVTLTHTVSGTSAGRAGALEIYGIRQDLSQADAKNNITTIDNVNITAEWDSEAILNNYVSTLKSYGYSEEDIEEMLAELGDVSNAHNAYKTMLGVQTLRTATGIVYRHFGGTLNLSNATIDIPYAFRIGADSEPRYGWVNVSDSVINTNHFGTERVDYTTFTRTTFKNDWSDGAIMIESGSSYQGDLNYIFKDCTFETAIQFALGTSPVNSGVENPTIKFENCTFNGTLMTEDNYQELISQYLSFYMSVTNYEAKVGTITFADGVLTVVPTRVAK